MNFKLVLKTYSQLRQLTDDERQRVDELLNMTDAERELLAETLGPPAKTSKPTTKKLKQCGTCGISKRAAHHRDTNHPQYHVFDEGGSGKSKRAESLAGKIAMSTARGTEMVHCTYESVGKICRGLEDDRIHDPTMGYSGYHPFQSASPAHSAPTPSSSSNGSPDELEVSSGAGTESV